MILKPLLRKFLAFSMLVLLGFSSVVTARPPKNFFLQPQQEGEVKKLPPVNWIRSRQIDVKHIAIDLKFDWEKESAFGVTTVTLAPFQGHEQDLSGRGGDDDKLGQIGDRRGFKVYLPRRKGRRQSRNHARPRL
jgi:hypothetical protein